MKRIRVFQENEFFAVMPFFYRTGLSKSIYLEVESYHSFSPKIIIQGVRDLEKLSFLADSLVSVNNSRYFDHMGKEILIQN